MLQLVFSLSFHFTITHFWFAKINLQNIISINLLSSFIKRHVKPSFIFHIKTNYMYMFSKISLLIEAQNVLHVGGGGAKVKAQLISANPYSEGGG